MDKLSIANCRGLKPVLNDIAKALKILDEISFEINGSESQREITKARQKLFNVISNEGYEFNNNGRLIKKVCNQ